MKVRPENTKSFSGYKVLSFDCFGTLIDWNEGMYKALEPLRLRLPPSHPLYSDRRALLSKFSSVEVPLVINNPTMLYSTVLQKAYTGLASALSLPEPSLAEAQAFPASIGEWPPFADTIEALKTLQKNYKLVILSNVDRASFAKVLAGGLSGITFDAIYTAEDIGSYKPDKRNLDYLVEHIEQDFGLKMESILHVAQSLRADHAPAKLIGLDSAWIVRGEEGFATGGEWADYDGKIEFSWKYDDMRSFVKDVEECFT